MNIFYTDTNPEQAARNLCDKHVVKMLLESCQMLSTAYRQKQPYGKLVPPGIYQSAYASHPCTEWVCEAGVHYQWLLAHAWELEREYQLRYNKYHAARKCLFELEQLVQLSGEWRDPPQCMPPQYKIFGDPVAAYRMYYIGEKLHFAKWTKRNPPDWLKDPSYQFVIIETGLSFPEVPSV